MFMLNEISESESGVCRFFSKYLAQIDGESFRYINILIFLNRILLFCRRKVFSKIFLKCHFLLITITKHIKKNI